MGCLDQVGLDRNVEQDTALRAVCMAEGLEVGVHAFSQYAKASAGARVSGSALFWKHVFARLTSILRWPTLDSSETMVVLFDHNESF